MFCYLWIHKIHQQPYLGIVEGSHFDLPELIAEKRSRMKILLLDQHKDLPLKTLKMVVQKAINLYKTGVIKLSDRFAHHSAV